MRKGGAACVSCRGDWYAQGDHARDAANHATAAEGLRVGGGDPRRPSAAEKCDSAVEKELRKIWAESYRNIAM